MLGVNKSRRGARRGTITIAGLIVVSLGLAACSSGNSPSTNGQSGANSPAAAAAAKVSITPAGGDQANPKTPIVVTASDGTLSAVTVTNAAKGTQVAGALSADKLTWTSSEPLGYGASYQVVASAVNKDGKTTEQKSTLQTVTPTTQAYPAMIPAPPGQGATFGVGQIFGISFDQDITDKAAAEKAVTVTTTPPQPGAWYWLDKKTAHYRAQTYWQAGTVLKMDVNVYGVNLGNGVYGKTDRTATYTIHDSWIAKADGNTDQMQILHNGQPVKSMPVSLGKDSTPTHVGPHVISDKNQEIVMDSCTYGVCKGDPNYYKATEHWAERISNDGEFVHENPNSVGAQGNTNVSHGCINLNTENATWFFNNFNLGDVVEVTNVSGPKLPIYDTYGDWELDWAEWQQGGAR
ncbi:L,D-transpeptidase [Solihabitans fulvus]|uniref:L,D-transpeptidase n=1 Tax=Solihabitans fulvus TaxID=1892852 RepID=A0A5B2WS18_9PSEU|nr:Ig-like domain-containing protein [Solihabitans fulvus]KAA2254481.1 L,D-transpeptidase [Solihabitans fulvus]